MMFYHACGNSSLLFAQYCNSKIIFYPRIKFLDGIEENIGNKLSKMIFIKTVNYDKLENAKQSASSDLRLSIQL